MTLMHYYSLAILRLSHDCLMYARSQCLQLLSTGTLISLHSTLRFTELGNLVHEREYERRIIGECILSSKFYLPEQSSHVWYYLGADLLQLVEEKKCWWIGTVFLFSWKFVFQLFFLSKKKIVKPHEVSEVFQILVSLTLAHQNAAHQALRPRVVARTVTNFGRYFEKSFLHWFGTLLMMVKHVFVWTELRVDAMSITHIQSGRELFMPVLLALPRHLNLQLLSGLQAGSRAAPQHLQAAQYYFMVHTGIILQYDNCREKVAWTVVFFVAAQNEAVYNHI